MIHPPHRLLLVDDDLEVRQGVEELLCDLGLEFLHAENGHEAVEVVRTEVIHAALLDMHMPGCTGAEALPLLFQVRRDLRCIVYSGRWTSSLEETVIAAGAQACLKKPVEPQALRREIRRALLLPPGPPAPGNLN